MKKLLAVSLISIAAVASAEMMDRPGGIKIGSHMTLRPYVSLAYTYDTNIDSRDTHETKSGSWTISPAAELSYDHENWGLDANVFYTYHAYEKKSTSNNNHSYGQSLTWHWADSSMTEKGWSLMLAENYHMTVEDDDMTNSGGQGYGRDRQQITVNAAAERRVTDKFHVGINGGYYWLDYKNDNDKYRPLYGWSRWMVGGETGYAFSRWTDILIAANYQGYNQDNDRNLDNFGSLTTDGRKISSDSKGFSVQGGLQTRATERISYRLLTGWSRFEYGGGAHTSDGWIYTASGNWRHSESFSSALMASSYFQPSETTYGGANRTDSISWGVQKSLLSSKLNSTFDIAYRRQEQTYSSYRGSNTKPVENILSYRFGLSYTINRFASIYGSFEYSQYIQSKGLGKDYDRIRGTVGVRLSY